MITAWTEEGWDDYLYWQSNDRKKLKRINDLIKDIKRNGPFHGIGKPEPLKENLSGYWSRRIEQEHRLVYQVTGTGDDQTLTVEVIALRQQAEQ